MIESKQLVRAFRYNSVDLPDPGAAYSAEEVRDLYSATYPEITSAAIEGPEEKDGKLVYTFRRPVGTKGGESPEDHLWTEREVATYLQMSVEFLQVDRHKKPADPVRKDWAIDTL